MKNKNIYAGIIILIAIMLAGQALEPTTQTQVNQQYIEEQNNSTINLTNTTSTPETNNTNTLETENTNPETNLVLPNCTGSYGKLIITNGNETYTLWDLLTPADSIKVYSTPDSTTEYEVYVAKKLIGPWLPAKEEARITTENSRISIYSLSGLYEYVKISVNDTQRKEYLISRIEKCVRDGNGTLEEKVKYVDAVVPQGRGHGGCGCNDWGEKKHCTTTTTTTTSTTTSTTEETTTTTTKPTTTTTTNPTTTTTRHQCSTTTTQPTTSTTIHHCTTTTQTTSTTTTTRHQCTTTKPTTTSTTKETTTTTKHTCTTTTKPSTPTTTHQITTTTRHQCTKAEPITTNTIKHQPNNKNHN